MKTEVANSIALAVLEQMEIAMLRRTGSMTYELFGQVPQFYRDAFCTSKDAGIRPWLVSSMMEHFIDEAEALFETESTNAISSGVWREDELTGDLALEATAFTVGAEHLLVIRCLGDEFQERTRILQKAREQLLAQRSLYSKLEQYRRQAYHDSLTGLYNRIAFMEHLEAEIRQAESNRGVFSLLLLDIDDFKQVNDTLGHLAGDTVLSSIGELLRQRLRRGDMAARYGGEELVVLAPNTGREAAKSMAESIRAAIAGYDFGLERTVTVSIGCATYRQGEDRSALFARADAAMYEAKRNGKNKVVLR
jgi:diguanylate cyclase (GGDEF) domain